MTPLPMIRDLTYRRPTGTEARRPLYLTHPFMFCDPPVDFQLVQNHGDYYPVQPFMIRDG